MNMDKFNILIDGAELLITGKKQPTMQDIISCRRGHAPNFGNLNLKIALPTDVVHTEGATATYEDGVLRIKFAKKTTSTGPAAGLPTTDALPTTDVLSAASAKKL